MASDAQNVVTTERPKKSTRRSDLLLDAAARQINARGGGAIDLAALAKSVGISRNALYYYIDDRADLLFRCYLRSCQGLAQDLKFAVESRITPQERIAAFVKFALSPDREGLAVLNDLALLSEERRIAVLELHKSNLKRLASLFEEGQEQGIFRTFDANLAAQATYGMVAWTLTSVPWLSAKMSRRVLTSDSQQISSLLLHGIASTRADEVKGFPDIRSFAVRNFNAFDRSDAADVKREQLIQAASRLFNYRGIEGVALDEIASSVGATKGVIYHYFSGKSQLVEECYRHAFDLYEKFMNEAANLGGSGLEHSLGVVHFNAQAQAGVDPPLVLQPGFPSLEQSLRDEFGARAQALWSTSQALLRGGMEDGSCRQANVREVAKVSAGAFLWLPKWLPEADGQTPVELADKMTDLLAWGVHSRC